MTETPSRLVNLAHYRPVGIKGWEFNPSHAEAISRIFKAVPLPPLEEGDPALSRPASTKPGKSRTNTKQAKGTVTKSAPKASVAPESDTRAAPVQIARIDWLPRGWPPTIPAPVDLTPESVTAFCDYLDHLISCFTYEIAQGRGPTLDLSFTDESLAINYLGKALKIPSPFGLNVQSGNQRDAAAIQQAIENLRPLTTTHLRKTEPTKIPPSQRSKPMTKKKAARLLGKPQEDSGVKWLNKCIEDRIIDCEIHSRQSFVFNIKNFPEAVHKDMLPPKSS